MSTETRDTGLQDLDARIAAAEWRVIQRDARVLQHGSQLGERLSSRSTQVRLALAGVAGVAAVVALARWSRRPKAVAASHRAGPAAGGRHAHPGEPAQEGGARPGLQPLLLQWLPLALQLITSSSRPATVPPPTGWMGWVGPLLAAGRGWAGSRTGRASRAATSAAAAPARPMARPPEVRR